MADLAGPEKARFVRTMFDAIARRYDLMNRLMTGGQDEGWRRLTADAVYPEVVRVAVDLGAGTGDLSFALATVARRAHVLSLDFSPQMLRLEDVKRRRLGLAGRVQPVLGDAMVVPVGDGAADAVVSAFTLRNVADIPTVLRECHRILRPEGRLAILELTPVRTPLFGTLFRFYFHRLVPLAGALVSGRGYAYRYLPESVQRFPEAGALEALMREAGFARASYRKLAAGTIALHVAEKGGRDDGAATATPAPAGATWSPPATPPVVVPAGSVRPLRRHQVTDARTWNAHLATIPQAHGMQTWEWGELRRETGWETHRLLFERGGVMVAAAAVQRRGLPAPLWGVSYCPKGPALDYADGPLLRRVLEDLAADARQQRSIVLTVEPEIESGPQAVAALRAAGYRPSATQLQSRSTVLVGLDGGEAAVMKRMSASWRRYVKKAARDGATVRRGGAADLGRFFELYTMTATRDDFVPRPADYLERLWAQLAPSGIVDLFLADVDGQAEAALLLMRWGTRAWYLYGASSVAGQRAHAPYLLQWEAMRWAQQHGCTVYDMWGAPDDPEDTDDPLAGVYYFKRGFGGRHARWVGPYDYVAVPALYGLWNEARPRVLGALRAAAAWGARRPA